MGYNIVNKPLSNPNPKKTFCRRYLYKDLDGNDYKGIISKFEERIKYWFIKPSKDLIRKKIPSNNFLITETICILIDLLSQYFYGIPSSNKKKYTEFLIKFMPIFKSKINPPIPHYHWLKKNHQWKKILLNNYAEAFYSTFRCSLLHNAMIGDNGRISGKTILKKSIKIISWRYDSKKGREIAVNAELLLKNVEKVFKEYIKKLRHGNDNLLKNNFAKKFEWDFGVKVSISN